MYAEWVAALDYTKEGVDPRQQLDSALGVSAWPVPGDPPRPAAPPKPAGAPAWWHGEEEASQSFLRGMGVTL